jgi:hypothetical protein
MGELARVHVFEAEPFLAFHALKFAKLFDDPGAALVRVDVAGRQYSRPHVHIRDVYVLVIKCAPAGVWTLSGERLEGYTWQDAMSVIKIPAHVPHCVSNPGRHPVTAIEFRTAPVEADNILIKNLEVTAEQRHRRLVTKVNTASVVETELL